MEGIDVATWNEVMGAKPKRDMIWYIYDLRHGGRKLRGAVCKTTDGKLGYSWANKRDLAKSSKKLTRHIAFERAAKCKVYPSGDAWMRERHGYATYIPREVYPHLDAMRELV